MAEPEARLLFVEDDAGKRYVVSRQLRMHGFDVDEASTGAQGLALLSPRHDVAILDMKLPDMHGSEVCRRIKADPTTASVMVLELSATFGTPEDRARGLDLGADAYLVHPVEPIELIATVRALVRLRRAEIEREKQRELLFGMVSHDLRNPLQTIVMAGQLLSESRGLGDAERRAVAALVRDSGRMSRLIEQLLIFTRSSAAHGMPVMPVDVELADVLARAASEPPASHEIIVENDVRGVVRVDRDRIEQLLDNLVTNAVRYGTSPVTIRARRDGEVLEISVHNRGAAIDPTALPTLFDPYRRASTAHKGAGLGLYIVRKIAEAHRGSIDVTSTEGEGTLFVVRLPGA
ncbi:MAG: response regulator [Deltaproteobacteria bacterium]|nr:response regulator [Deltaproteobacteria bacterium]